MLTGPEAAARLRCDAETIRRWIRSSRLRARKMGSQHVIEEQDLEALLEKDTLPLPPALTKTSTGEPMPNVVAALRRSGSTH